MKPICKPWWLFWALVFHAASCVAVLMLPTTAASKHDRVTLDGYTTQTKKQEREVIRPIHMTETAEKTRGGAPVPIPPSLQRSIPANLKSPQTPVELGSSSAKLRNAIPTTTDSLPPPTDDNITHNNDTEMNRGARKKSLTFGNAWAEAKKGDTFTVPSLQASVTHGKEVEEDSEQVQTAREEKHGAPNAGVLSVSAKDVWKLTDTLQITNRAHSVQVSTPSVLQTTTLSQGHLFPNDYSLPDVEKQAEPLGNSLLATDMSKGTMVTKTDPQTAEVRCNYTCCHCNCETAKAKCAGLKTCLHSLPQLPACIKDFFMTGADLVSLTRHMLASLSNVNITAIRLPSNRISRVDPDTFADFHHLKWLDLSENAIPVTQLGTALEHLNSKRLFWLKLDKMSLKTLPDNLFDVFTDSSLEKLSLKENQLQSFDSRVFAPFFSVELLDLSMNDIVRVNISTRLNVRILKLRDNNFVDFPDFCLRQSPTTVTSAFDNLQGLYIGSKHLSSLSPSRLSGVCFPSLAKLDISASDRLYRLESNFVADLPTLEFLLISSMPSLRMYEPLAFNSSSLTKLSLRDNRKVEEKETTLSFQRCSNLERLWISNVHLHFSEEMIWRLLRPLSSLRGLYLHKVSMYALPLDLLWRFPRLQELDLRTNGITSSRLALALQNVTSLKRLNLRENKITVVNESTLPWPVRQHLTYLDMSMNPFSCSCEQRWFKRWLDAVTRNHSVKVGSYPSPHYYVCDSPPSRRGLSFDRFHLTDEECTALNLGLLLGVSGSSLLALVSLVLALAYRYRWYLRFYLYRCRRRRQGGERDELLLYQYDVYLAYSPGDLDWVCEELLPLLEQDHGLHTFLLDRDTVPGTVMADNITRFMDKSARILLLLSDTYTREQWRLYELEHIVYAAIDQQKDVIVVLLGDVTAGRMTKNMRRMLTRGTFLQWDSSSEEAQRVFREGLRVALKTEDTGFHTLC